MRRAFRGAARARQGESGGSSFLGRGDSRGAHDPFDARTGKRSQNNRERPHQGFGSRPDEE
jgi:hypothetical protein